jgi:hypothetical protein
MALLAAAFPSGETVLAQEPPTIDTLNLSLWPEYDRPGLLVIYRAQFGANTPLPLPVEIRIPVEAGGPSAVAYLDEQSQPIQQEYTSRTEDDWVVVSMELPTRGLQLEYYLPLPDAAENNADTGQRLIPFTYTADYPVTRIDVDVQEPVGVTDFSLDPAATSTEQGSGGVTYYLSTAGPLAQNGTATWTISYNRTTPGLTVDAAPSPTAAPAPAAASSGESSSGLLIVLGALLAMAGVGAAAFWFGKQSAGASRPAPAAARSPAKRKTGARGGAEAAFCHQCGTRLRPGAEFCQQCGAGVRKPARS